MSEQIRVVIGDDHPVFREGVAAVLNAEPDLCVVGREANAAATIRACGDTQPDIVVLDIDMPGGGLTAIPVIRDISPTSKIVMLTVSASLDNVMAALKAGAHGYVLKGVGAHEFIAILRATHAGEGYISPALAARLLAEMPAARSTAPVDSDGLTDLTERERQVLEQVATGRSNREIASELHLTERTVKQYATNIFQKLHVRNRVKAALLVRKNAP